jgi:hypothetical protein
LALIASLAAARDLELRKTAGDYSVLVRIDRNPPVVGTNRIEVEIEDAAGARVTDAKVLINYYMPPMPRMAPMNYKVEAALKDGKYREKMKLIMAGPWIIAVKITRSGKTTTAKFSIDAR